MRILLCAIILVTSCTHKITVEPAEIKYSVDGTWAWVEAVKGHKWVVVSKIGPNKAVAVLCAKDTCTVENVGSLYILQKTGGK